jgi:trehalose 6-phosphate synthase
VIVVSHRGPFQFVRRDDGTIEATRGAGGVVSVLGPLAAATTERTTWVAAALSPDDAAAVAAGATTGLGIDLHLVVLDPQVHALHYDVVSNGVLWFLLHGLFDATRRPRFDLRFREAWDAYVEVNRRFADEVARSAAAREIVLVQDYQLALVPELLREQRDDLRIVHFVHTPFCDAQDVRVLPTDVAGRICRSLAAGPLGFHTARWARAYARAARDVLGRAAHVHPPFVASLGPDVPALREVAATEAARAAGRTLSDLVGDRMLVLRTDRIEPSKNLVRGFLAFDRLLEARPGLRQRVVFVAMVYPSRQGLAEYLAYGNEVDQTVERVNERWATGDWVPIVLDGRDDFARSVAGLERYDVLVVNPVRDGLNLVAKEGPVLNRRDGVLCLSREAGAFEELRRGVVAMHPFDVEQMAVALDDALSMPLDERAATAARLRDLAAARTPAAWLADLVAQAGD